MTAWLVNGEPGAMVSPDDRGLLYGDGLFETIAFHQERSRLWALHMDRLRRGCSALRLPPPDEALLAEEARRLVAGHDRAVIRLTLTRGVGGRAYFPPRSPEPTRILLRRDWPGNIERRRSEGLVMRTSPIRSAGGFGGGIKHLNRLEQVMVADDLARQEAEEALVVDADGWIVEGLAGNIVVERDGRLIAPGPHPAAVAGVGLEWLRSAAGADLVERPMRADELESGDAIWVINSVQGPCAVASLDQRPLAAGGTLAEWQSRWRKEVEE